ncbi:phospholipase A and acyltransferase 3-like isoform X2 [Artemia franciscana]|uniref:phospholipase A and acyltransferase 3-like isoform X2 n=1 Tax=Artemia franciscana TaxID=6661 RepID=UPI0032DB73D0
MDSAASPSLEAVSSSAVTERTSEDDYPNKGYKSDWFRNAPILREEFLKKLHIGDLLEFDRLTYKHWAVYVGCGKNYDYEVVHFCNVKSSFFSGSSASKYTEGENTNGNPVQNGDLYEVWSDDLCRINNSFDGKSAPFPWYEIYNRAILFSVAPGEGFEEYNLLQTNCEHFAHWIRNHYAESNQVKEFLLSVYEKGLYTVSVSLFL